MAETAAPTSRPDERLVSIGILARLLMRPDSGAFLGAVGKNPFHQVMVLAHGTSRDIGTESLDSSAAKSPGEVLQDAAARRTPPLTTAKKVDWNPGCNGHGSFVEYGACIVS